MTALRIVLETDSNEARRDRHKIGDSAALLDGDGKEVALIGRIKAIELLDDHRLALTVDLDRAVSITGEKGTP